jgi:hypothetical protein
MMSPSFALITTCSRDETSINRSYFTFQLPIYSIANSPHTTVKKHYNIYISYISHFVVRVQLAELNWWVVFNLSSCGLYLPLSVTQPLSHRILTNKNRKRHIPYAYMNNDWQLLWHLLQKAPANNRYLAPSTMSAHLYNRPRLVSNRPRRGFRVRKFNSNPTSGFRIW